MVFRRDRIACIRGAENLQAMRLRNATKTRRMLAGCCTTPMYVGFDDKRPWVSAFRTSFGPDAPPVQMRICTRFRRPEHKAKDDLPDHPGYPAADSPRSRRMAAYAVQPAGWRFAVIRAPDSHRNNANTIVFYP
jgi:hypothetical protein